MNFTDFFKTAKYVRASSDDLFPYIRKSFNLNAKVKSATLYISALGFCDIFLNGKKITEDLYITPHAMYNPQKPEELYINPSAFGEAYFNDELGYSVYVSKFDVAEFLSSGKNAFGLTLAGGWYYTLGDKYKNYRNFGKPAVAFRIEIEFENGEKIDVVSNSDCKWHQSYLTLAGIFHEEQDERKEIKDFANANFDDSAWESTIEVDHYDSKYILNQCPPNRIISWHKPTLIKQTETEKLYDMGFTMTGFPVVINDGKAGDTITCQYGETLDENGNLDEFHAYCQESVFVTDDRKEHFLRFTWHGFRYFTVKTTGNLDAIDVEKVALTYADIKNTSTFECNLDVVNFIYNAYILTQNENYQCGVPCDCPQIERKGYTGDGQVLCELGLALFDSEQLYRKWLNDISDVQDRKTGFVHNTAPVFCSCGGGPGGWSVAIVNVPYAFYKQYGDLSILERFYPQMKKYKEFIDDEAIDNLVTIKKRKAHCLGDWNGPKKPLLPEPFCNSCMYVEALMRMVEVANILGHTEDVPAFQSRIEEVKKAINDTYFDCATGDYCGNEQASNAFALNIGLGDERTLKNLVARYTELQGFDTGIFGTKFLPKILFKMGYPDLAMSLYTSTSDASYYKWMKDGETTLLEAWSNARSHNHPMFGSPVLWLFEYVLGIRQVEGSVGYKKIVVNPSEAKAITNVKGSLLTPMGRVAVEYKKADGKIEFNVEIPEGVECEFSYKGYAKTLCAGQNKIAL